MPTTTNYGWTTPADTDLVKDGAAAIRTLGNSVDTTTKNLNPETTLGDIAYRSSTANTNTRLPIGTTGQVLTVAAGVPSWATPNVGDITAVTAGTGLTGGGTSGDVSLAIDSTVATLSGTQTLTNKTIALGSNTVSGTTAEFNTALTDGDFATLAGTETLTNKTLTSPVLTTPTISTIDAKGDLLAGTADNTIARLGVGANGTVLTADSAEATGLKWATPSASTPTFVGCRLTKSADQTISNATFTAISFNGEDFDTDGFHDNATNNSRITIPTGKGGKYLFTVSGYFADNATGTRTTALYKNGSLIPKARCIWRREGLGISAVLSLVATDYIELFVYQDSGGNLDVNDATSIQASYLGA